MATNSVNQQISSFNKGMDTDTSDVFIGKDSYRFARNLRFLTDKGENSGELRLIEGYEQVAAIDEEILATTQIRNIGIIITKTDPVETPAWNIYKFDKDSPSNKTLIFGPCTNMIGDHISTVTKYESEDVVKLYIADEIHRLMCVNISQQYNSGDIKLILSGNTVPLDQPTVEIVTGGHIQQSVTQYAYKLYNIATTNSQISPLSKPCVINTDSTQRPSNKACSVTIPQQTVSGLYSRIILYRISYIQNGQEPTINIVYDGEYVNSITDYGNNIDTLSAAEFISQTNIQFRPVLIESKNDYLFAANINYNQKEIDDKFKNVIVTYSQVVSDSAEFSGMQGLVNRKTNVVESSEYDRSFQPGETYRFGIVFYDADGNRSSVMQINDITFQKTTSTDYWPNTGFTNYITASKKYVRIPKYGIKAQLSNALGVAGYEIVRCERTINDSKCITQGIVGLAQTRHSIPNTNLSGGLWGTDRFAFPYLSIQEVTSKNGYEYPNNDDYKYNFKTSNDLVMFASPEYCYQADDIKNTINTISKDNLKLNLLNTYKAEPLAQDGGQSIARYWQNDVMRYINSYIGIGYTGTYFPCLFILDGDHYDCYLNGTKYHDGKEHSYLDIDPNEIRILQSLIFPADNAGSTDYTGEYDISAVGFAKSPDPYSFNEGDSIRIQNDSTTVDDLNFINWNANDIFCGGDSTPTQKVINELKYTTEENYVYRHSISTGGKYILLKANVNSKDYNSNVGCMPITVGNIENTSVSPNTVYGGNSEAAKNNSIFYSFGAYKSKDPNSAGDYNTCYIGDIYTYPFIFYASHAWRSDKYVSTSNPTIYICPIETRLNLQYRGGDIYSQMDFSWMDRQRFYYQDEPTSILDYIQDKPAYVYNTAYSSNLSLVTYNYINWDEQPSEQFDCRVLVSNQKQNNERIDNWQIFKSANFIDVDTRYGQITNLRLFKDSLIYWQEGATGVLSVNERTILQDTNNTNIILGNGDVLQRYDYITTEFGMLPYQFADTQSNTTLYWWDGNKKDILAYNQQGGILPMKKLKLVSNYINKSTSLEKPALVYDNKYSEVLMSVVNNTDYDSLYYHTNGKSPLVYNEITQQFTSVYERPFDYKFVFFDKLMLADNTTSGNSTTGKIYEWNKSNTSLLPYLKYIVNDNSTYVKVYDNVQLGIGDAFYGSWYLDSEEKDHQLFDKLRFKFHTPLGQHSTSDVQVTANEYDFKFAIPRNGVRDPKKDWGDRMRGKTMQCEIGSEYDPERPQLKPWLNFSLQYIITKYRISWN